MTGLSPPSRMGELQEWEEEMPRLGNYETTDLDLLPAWTDTAGLGLMAWIAGSKSTQQRQRGRGLMAEDEKKTGTRTTSSQRPKRPTADRAATAIRKRKQ
ncbi:hypothetical protein QR685DRAFT_466028 [Neurospora intermedia]|uniref:Uncharacterized protein n=1 Tax=Neurospora intermedia TaxID=5142 RepID=A0ABR3DRL3_NEUIN